MGYQPDKHQLYQKLGSVSFKESTFPQAIATSPEQNSAKIHVKQRHFMQPIVIVAGMVLGLAAILTASFFTVANGSFADIYVAGQPVKANIAPAELQKQIETASKKYKVKVKYTDGKVKSFSLAETGITVDSQKSTAQAKKQINQSLLKRLKWWQPIQIDLATKTDDDTLYSFTTKEVTQVKEPAKDAALVIANGTAMITPEADGNGSTVEDAKKKVAARAIGLDTMPLALKPMKLKPAIKTSDLESSKAKADALLTKSVTFSIAGHNVAATPTDIGGWLDISPVPNHKTVDVNVNSGKVLQYIDKVARRYITPPHSRLVTTTDTGQLVLDVGSDGVDVVNKEKTASEVASKVANDKSVSQTLAVQYTPAKTVETKAYDKWFVADVTTKRMYAYEGTKLVRTFLTSNGAPATPTVTGTYKIYTKYRSQTMTGFNADGSRYRQPDVPYVNYFTGGYAIHGNYWRPASYFGNINSSHGCIGINVTDAAWIYDWAPIGTTVVVHK